MELTTLSRRVFVVLSIALLQWTVGNPLDITVANGGYGNVVVAIGNDLNRIECENYIISIKAMMDSASTLLYTATGNRMFFANVTIVIPSNWTCDGVIIEDSPIPLAFEGAHIRVQTSHPFFADNPWTQQPGGCEDPGEYMYFSDGFLSDTSPELGDHGTVFVHEWAKFRWGVFEEYGHAGDSVFPSAYRDNSSMFQPNYCTNGRIDGNLGPSCGSDDQEADCTFTPTVAQTGNATSSLLAVPFTSTVNTFCHSSNHDTTVPTKQNLMCNKKSTWDVISLHHDITQTTPSTNKENTTYSIQRMAASTSQHRIVFLLDVTKSMDGVFSRWAYVRDAVRQFIWVRAAEGSQVAVIHFGTAPPLPKELTTLNSANRDGLAQSVQERPGNDTTKVVALAISAAAETLGSSGQIILITESLTEHTEDSKTLVANAKGLAVLPILYPYTPDVDITLYERVAQVADLVPHTVNNTLVDGSLQAVDCLFDITQLIQSAGRDTLTLVKSETFEGKWPLSLQLTVENASSYESQYFVEVLVSFPSKPLEIEIKDPSGFVLREKNRSDSSRIYLGDALQDGVYTINSNFPLDLGKAYASIYAIPLNTSDSQPYNIVVSASKPLNNLVYTGTPPTAPIIYAMLSDGVSPIVFAEVTANIRNVLSSGSINNFTLSLSDNGVGGDVTGNDGTYSSYLVGIEEVGTVSISISASDNNGSARLVGPTPTLNSAPVNPAGLQRACCGSSLLLTNDLLVEAGKFSIGSAPGINGQATGNFPTPNAYPPGRVTDLKGSQVWNEVNLTFTATGEDFNIGQATSYIVKNGVDAAFTQELNISVGAGTVISTFVGVECDKRYSLTVEAVDSLGTRSDPSNEVHVLYSCVVNQNGLSTGAIVGITLGVLFFVLLLVLIACSYKNRDSLKDSKLCQMMTCQCLKKKKTDKDKKSSHLVTSRTGKDSDFIRSNPAPRSINSSGHIRASAVPAPARGVEDLYRNSNGKRREESDSDGGFGDRRMQQGNVRMSDLRQSDDSSEASSVASRGNPRIRPSNRVGIPLANSPAQYNRAAPSIPVQAQRQYNPGYGAHDNNSYNDSESGVYSVSTHANFNKRPVLPPLQPRNNTQV